MSNLIVIQIYLLVICSSLFVAYVFWKTRKRIGLLHFILLMYCNYAILRPFGLIIIGGSFLYQDFFTWDAYVKAYTINMFFLLCLCSILLLSKNQWKSVVVDYKGLNDFNVHDRLVLIVCMVSLFFLFLTTGDKILSINRVGSLGAASPYARFFFPLAMITSGILIARGVILLIVFNRYILGYFIIIFALFSIIIVGQRGVAIIFLFMALAYCWNLGFKFKASVGLLLLLFIALFSRLVLVSLFNLGAPDFRLLDVNSFFQQRAMSPDGDTLEVFVIAIKFVNENGVLYGVGLINNIFSFASSEFRLREGLLHTLDVLNSFYNYDVYWNLKFGFNVNVVQELYVNFGFASIVFAPFLYYPLYLMYRSYNSKINRGYDPVYTFMPLYAVFVITSSFAGIAWVFVIMFLYYFIYRMPWQRWLRNLCTTPPA